MTMQFSDLKLKPAILRALDEKGYTAPSPIQEQVIPVVLQGRDVLAAAQTGTGKTAGFTLPMLELLSEGGKAQANQVRALVLTPTRELAAQVAESVKTYGANLPLRSTVVFGGVKINPQMIALRRGADILVATPGRLLDLYQQNAVRFKQLEMLVLDEADRMLDMGFIHDIKNILSLLPEKRQNLLFSATFSDEVRQLARTFVHNPVEVSVTPRNSAAKTVKQWLCPVDKKQKPALLAYLIETHKWYQVLVFSRTKHGANKLTRFLESKGIKALAIHGNKSQSARTKALEAFKKGKVQVLVATDIAARGLDIDQLPQVVNFDLPNVAEDYVHRIGRTGRAGAEGQAVSLVSADEIKQLSDIERLIQKKIARELVDGFEPVHDVPETQTPRPPKKKKPKRVKNQTTTNNEGQARKRPAAGSKSGSRGKLKTEARVKPNARNKVKADSKSDSKSQDGKRQDVKKQSGKASGPNSNRNSHRSRAKVRKRPVS